MTEGMILIIGGNSQIGVALTDHFEKRGLSVLATSRRRNSEGLFLDLAEPEIFNLPENIKGAVFCAGITEIQACERDPVGTRKINVEGTIKVLQKLKGSDIFTIFLSTNLVFDGSKPDFDENASPHPQTVYASQKIEVENWLKSNSSSAVVRLTKVLGTSSKIFLDWKESFSKKEIVKPFKDLVFAPITLGEVGTLLEKIITAQKAGTYHLSSEDLSYAEACQIMAQEFHCPDLVQPQTSSEAGVKIYTPRYSSLGCSKTLKEFSLRPSLSHENLKTYFRSLRIPERAV